MASTKTKITSKQLTARLIKLRKISGLEISGFAEFINISESHVYAMLNGTREITEGAAEKIANKFGISAKNLTDRSYKLTEELRNAPLLKNFYNDTKHTTSYFIKTNSEGKSSFFVENKLYKSGFFDKPVYVKEVRSACSQNGFSYTSKQISQILNYMVDRKLLKRKKKPIILANGKTGKRMVDVFYK
ncbi:XRE family transcriptional regulator [Lacibacter luteus]|uniref:XRE family transcriptional regulator n=1 Tax=Lacibacter luteus TaxID=2508719 RepID=A0A4Q1CJX1_9BACT|nr:helix-turn-helix transcriptional regulator [Lacibacter luteus]RXK60664.1 XRE family transcriptional regulator [Lacibacter luteus]